MTRQGTHAVVLGAGIGGLLAARVLAGFYERVTVVERDELPEGTPPAPRRGVPQGRHLHVLLAGGARALEGLFPGLTAELVARGAPEVESPREVRGVFSGHELARAEEGVLTFHASRPLLERVVRTRVAAMSGVTVVQRCSAAGFVFADGSVTGARITPHTSSPGTKVMVQADLVVDALGRTGRAAAWLPELGFDPPDEDRIACDNAYVSRFVRMAPGGLGRDQAVIVGAIPGRPRAMGLGAQEGDRWLLSIGGMAGDHPPTDDEGFLSFVETVAPPDVYAAIRDAEPLSELVVHRFPASVRRHYERLRRFPDGLLVFGDAICSFNPVYGQGMTVAALQAEALQRCLQAGDHDLARRFFRAAAKVIDPAWNLSAGGDLALPEIPGDRPLRVRIINRYVAQLHRAAAHDLKVATAFVRVANLLDPPSAIMTPAVLARVLVGQRRTSRRRITPDRRAHEPARHEAA
jgi:2-polyprenyl-6-methoxyphenol hydroxylase-like FAD-dependent oxidoreductase